MATAFGSRVKVIFEELVLRRVLRAQRGIAIGDQQPLDVGVYSDATRPTAGTAGRVIFNTTDGNLNIDTGSAWILPNGTGT